MSTPAASSNLTYNQWIGFFTKQTLTECQRTVFENAFDALQESTKNEFLDVQKPLDVDPEDTHKGPRFLPLAFPEEIANSAGVAEDRIATDKDKELWLRFSKANHFKGLDIAEMSKPDDSGQRLDLISTLMGAYNLGEGNALQINTCAYSGHGISKQYADALNLSHPSAAQGILQQQNDNRIATPNKLGYCRFFRDRGLNKFLFSVDDGFRFNVGDGILRPHKVPDAEVFVGIHDISSYWLEAMDNLPNKFLVVILDSCYSGEAAEILPGILASAVRYSDQTPLKVASSSAIVIQYACKSNEFSYPGYFTPTFMRLQHPATRHAMGALYEAVSNGQITLQEGIMPSEETGLPRQNVGLFVSNKNFDNIVQNCSPHPKLYFENCKWPIVLIKDAFFFEFCHRVFQYDAAILDADAEDITRGDLGFPQEKFTRLEELLAEPNMPNVHIFNFWLTKYGVDGTKMAIIPFKFSMPDDTMVVASAHYHHDDEGRLTCVNYYECKVATVAPLNDNLWFDKRSKRNGPRYRETKEAGSNYNLSGDHDRLYEKSIMYVKGIEADAWDKDWWTMDKAWDQYTYCFRGTNTLAKRGEFEEEALAKLIENMKNTDSAAASNAT